MYDTLIDVERLRARLHDPDWVVVDCRYDLADAGAGRRAWQEAHIAGAVFADLLEDLSDPRRRNAGRHPLPAADELRRLFSRLGIDANTQVVAYDAGPGAFAARLWWLLRYMGHARVAVLDGGWQAWIDAGAECDAEVPRRAPRHFTGSPDAQMLAHVDQVPALPLLLDARDAARFRGEVEPLDPVAGHIPGARNRPWQFNLDPHGRFLPAAELRTALQPYYDAAGSGGITCYCGSGVTACHHVLAAAHAGLPMPRLYAGSWSEWCADPRRAVARGGA